MSNSLYEQLKAGTSAEDIAAAFTAELNKAEEQLRAEREAEEKAKVAADAVKLDEAAALLRELVTFISHYYPSLGLEGGEDFTEDDYRLMAELILVMLDLEALKPAKRSFKIKSYTGSEAKVEKPTVDDECTETVPRAVRGQRAKADPIDEALDPFASFFKTFNL